jgi:two-component system response regulator RegX3
LAVATTDESPRVLIVEDEDTIADAVRYGLERAGFRCSVASDGIAALERFEDEGPDLVLLDLMLPGMAGEDVCRAIRRDAQTPLIILSAKDSEVDRILGLELGADDYITKPFSPRELVARVRSVLRRWASDATDKRASLVRAGPIDFDPERHEVRIRGSVTSFPPKEFALLECLLRRRGRLCTREWLISTVWGFDYVGDTRTLDVHVKRLRSKLEEDARHPTLLQTVRGLGYKLSV